MVAHLPRQDLATRAAEWLREGIRTGVWRQRLPGERVLSERAGISRPVLREGLRRLEDAGVLVRESNRRRIIVSPLPPARTATAPAKVIFLVGADEEISLLSERRIFHHVTERLWRSGVETEVRRHPSLERSSAGRVLAEWTDSEPPDTRWVLLSVSRHVQRWFSDRSFPALVVGSVYPGVVLRSFDTDYRAIGRHAAARFLGSGHRNILLLSLERPRAGDLECEAGFVETCGSFTGQGLRYAVVRTRRNPEDFAQLLRRTCLGTSAPTAILVCHAQLALTALTLLQSSGRRIPEDISLLCRDEEKFLAFTRPAVAHYCHDDDTHPRRLARFILGTRASLKIVPRFVNAASFAGRKTLAESGANRLPR